MSAIMVNTVFLLVLCYIVFFFRLVEYVILFIVAFTRLCLSFLLGLFAYVL